MASSFPSRRTLGGLIFAGPSKQNSPTMSEPANFVDIDVDEGLLRALQVPQLPWEIDDDELYETEERVPGVHEPNLFLGHGGSVTAVHIEDQGLLSVNVVLRGEKLWIIVPAEGLRPLEAMMHSMQEDEIASCAQVRNPLRYLLSAEEITEVQTSPDPCHLRSTEEEKHSAPGGTPTRRRGDSHGS